MGMRLGLGLVVLMVWGIGGPVDTCGAVQWILACESCNGKEYYDKESLEDKREEKTLKIWTKRVYTPKVAEDLKNRMGLKDGGKLSYTISQYTIDYENKKYVRNSCVHFDEAGNMLLENKEKLKSAIIPGSIMEMVLKKILAGKAG